MGVNGTISIHDHRLGLYRLLFAADILGSGLQRQCHCVATSYGNNRFYFISLKVALRGLNKVTAHRQSLGINLPDVIGMQYAHIAGLSNSDSNSRVGGSCAISIADLPAQPACAGIRLGKDGLAKQQHQKNKRTAQYWLTTK